MFSFRRYLYLVPGLTVLAILSGCGASPSDSATSKSDALQPDDSSSAVSSTRTGSVTSAPNGSDPGNSFSLVAEAEVSTTKGTLAVDQSGAAIPGKTSTPFTVTVTSNDSNVTIDITSKPAGIACTPKENLESTCTLGATGNFSVLAKISDATLGQTVTSTLAVTVAPQLPAEVTIYQLNYYVPFYNTQMIVDKIYTTSPAASAPLYSFGGAFMKLFASPTAVCNVPLVEVAFTPLPEDLDQEGYEPPPLYHSLVPQNALASVSASLAQNGPFYVQGVLGYACAKPQPNAKNVISATEGQQNGMDTNWQTGYLAPTCSYGICGVDYYVD